MSVVALLGAQWGDEGKGHIADYLAAEASLVARYNGGDNAGHTIVIGEKCVRAHLVPAGAFHKNAVNLLGSGMVINLRSLATEIDALNEEGAQLSPERLKIDARAHLLFPTHIALDGAGERKRGENAIGTTKRGIGPAYSDKYNRFGIRAGEMVDLPSFGKKLHDQVERTNFWLSQLYDAPPLDATATVAEYSALAQRFAPHLTDGVVLIHNALKRGEAVIAEGAQGTLLDIDHGSYPFVTSSSTTTGGILTSLGIAPRHLTRIIGVAKAYCTRVGAGPFPTELLCALGDRLRGTGANLWDEFGATTGRPRRTGWLDLVALRHAARVNGLTELVLTKLDILADLDPLLICTSYRHDKALYVDFPPTTCLLEKYQPVLEPSPSWGKEIAAARNWHELPHAARDYITKIETFVEVPITYLSVGPERSQIFSISQRL